MDPSNLRRRARVAYELGRLCFAGRYAAVAGLVVAVVWVLAPPTTAAYVLGGALVVGCGALAFGSRQLAHQVRPGLIAGFVPMVAALASMCTHGCASDCDTLCAPVCVVAGLAVGVWLGRSGHSWAALLIASLTAGVACLPIGASTLLGALLGLALGSVPLLAARRV